MRAAIMNNNTGQSTPSASVHYLQSLLRVMAERQVDGHALFARTGLDPDLFRHPDSRVPFALLLDAWHLAMEELDDPGLGLLGAEQFHPAIYGPLASIIMTSPTLGDVATQLVRFQAIPEDATHAELAMEGSEVVISFDSEHFDQDRIRPVGVTPQFNESANEVRFDAQLLALPTACPDPELFQSLLERIAERQPRATLAGQVEQFLASALPRGVPRIAEVAEQLSMTVRTLQRKLEQEGWRYAELLDDVRQRLAQALLSREEASVTEVAFLLGFSEPSAFHKAFQRWTGESPGEWRRRQTGKVLRQK
jgi:AraC-like DNA-binding protein